MNLRWALNQIGALAFGGLLAGAVAGWIAIASQDGAGAVAGAAADLRYVLFVLLPLAALARAWVDARGHGGAYRGLPGAVGASAVLGAIGGAAGAALWLVIVMQISGVFGGEDPAEVMRAVRAMFGWDSAGIAVVAGTVGGAAAGVLGHRRAASA